MGLGALCLLAVGACAPTLAHPMRVKPGVMLEVATLIHAPAGRTVDCNFECVRSRPSANPPVPYGSIGWGAVVDDHVGLLVGLTMPGRSELDRAAFDLGPRVFGVVTYQEPWGSIGLEADVGIFGAAPGVFAEARPWRDPWAPRLGVFHRWWIPYVFREPRYSETTGLQLGGLYPAWDFGARVTAGFLFVQWSLTVETRGLRQQPIFVEGADYSDQRHIVSFGVTTDVQP